MLHNDIGLTRTVICCQTALNGKNNFGKDERMAAWATETRTQHGLETGQKPMHERNGATKLSSLAD